MKKFFKFTRRNKNGTYRITMNNGMRLSIDAGMHNLVEPCITGDVANRLGEYEAIGSPEEFARLKGVSYEKVRTRLEATIY